MNCKLLLLPLLLIFTPGRAQAQEMNIVDDTIKVSNDYNATIQFPGDISDARFGCNSASYSKQISGSSITIMPKTSKPVSPCKLFVNEEEKKRKHTFIIIFLDSHEQFDDMHDFSTTKKLKERIEYLEDQKQNAVTASPAPHTAPAVPVPDVASVSASVAHAPAPAAVPVLTAPPRDTSNITVEGLLLHGNIPIADFEQKVNRKIEMFNKDCEKLCGTKQPQWVDYGMKVFANDNKRIVETTNARSKKITQKHIHEYLYGMTQLNYERMVMTSKEISYATGFKKGVDGNYYATAVVLQDFSGIRDGKIVYNDQVKKTYDIILKVWDETKDGVTQQVWDIFLGNISVNDYIKE